MKKYVGQYCMVQHHNGCIGKFFAAHFSKTDDLAEFVVIVSDKLQIWPASEICQVTDSLGQSIKVGADGLAR